MQALCSTEWVLSKIHDEIITMYQCIQNIPLLRSDCGQGVIVGTSQMVAGVPVDPNKD